MKSKVLKTKTSFIVSLVLAALAGLAIVWIDSRPGWDDTGITVAPLELCKSSNHQIVQSLNYLSLRLA